MMPLEEWHATLARRALLRQQTELIGPRLPWLADPARIPDDAIASSVAHDDIHLAAFSLAGWMLIEFVRAANHVHLALDWERAIEQFEVAPRLHESVARAVLAPASRHAPGLFAIAEIISVVPKVASRAGLRRDRWPEVAARAQAFGSALARDSTAVQVLIRSYLSRTESSDDHRGLRALNAAWLRLDDVTGLTTVTPVETVLAAAREAAARHGHSYHATCVALQARAPEALAGTIGTMFGAIWSSFTHAADRLVFPRFNPDRDSVPPEAGPDAACAATLESLAAQRREVLSATASQPYPEAVEDVLRTLVESGQR